MPRLIWTPEALRDIQSCYRFLAPKNPAAASNAVRTIREGMRVVAEHPGAGRPVERMDPEFLNIFPALKDGDFPSFRDSIELSQGDMS